MSASILTDEQLVELRKSLPYGAIADIMKKTRLTRTFVSLTLNGKKRDTKDTERVIRAAIEVLEEWRKERQELRQRFDNLKIKSA